MSPKPLALYGLQIVTSGANYNLNYIDEKTAQEAFQGLTNRRREYLEHMWTHGLTSANADGVKATPPSRDVIHQTAELRYLTLVDEFSNSLDLDIGTVLGVNLANSEEGVKVQSIMERFKARGQIKAQADVQKDPVIALAISAAGGQQHPGRN